MAHKRSYGYAMTGCLDHGIDDCADCSVRDGCWTKDDWVCEDCRMAGADWGAPDDCPSCGSSNITTDPRETNAQE